MPRIIIFLFVLFVFVPAQAEDAAPSQKESASRDRMQTYYRNPDSKAVIDDLVATNAILQEKGNLPFSIGSFFSHLINADPKVAIALVDKARNAGDGVKKTVAVALVYSNHPKRMDLAQSLIGKESIDKVPGIGQIPSTGLGQIPSTGLNFKALIVQHPIHLDMLWSSFFATGDGIYIERIAGVLGDFISVEELRQLGATAEKDPKAKEKMWKGVIAQAAAWSLGANARAYPEVKVALAAYAANNQGLAPQMAGAILRAAKPSK